jgi:hypothetical protein
MRVHFLFFLFFKLIDFNFFLQIFFHNFLSMRSSKSYIHGHEVCEFTQFNSFFFVFFILSLFNIELFDNPNMLKFFFIFLLIFWSIYLLFFFSSYYLTLLVKVMTRSKIFLPLIFSFTLKFFSPSLHSSADNKYSNNYVNYRTKSFHIFLLSFFLLIGNFHLLIL